MIGSRCLGPGGSAVRSRAARAPSIAAAPSSSIQPLAECSYRTWQPPQLARIPLRERAGAEACASASRRCFSCSSYSRRSHAGSTGVNASVDHHGIESFMHDPPFTSGKVKRLRPVAGPAPIVTTSTGNVPPFESIDPAADQRSDSFTPRQHAGSTKHTSGSRSHPPDNTLASRLGPHLSPPNSHPDIPPRLLLDYLTEPDKDAFQRIKAQLPPGFHRIDAYLLLREIDPQSLSALSYHDIFSLIKRAEKDDLGAVLAMLLQDIVGPDMSNPKAKSGLFQVYAGTEERYRLLRELLVRCHRSDYMIYDGALLNVFLLMLDDLSHVRQLSDGGTGANSEATSGTAFAASASEGTALTLPASFPIGETRRLVGLAVSLHSPELLPVINALRAHLEAHTPDFPTAREGSKLIAYYLQPDLREFAAALDVVRALRDTNAIAQEVVDDAIRDGKQYLAGFESLFASNPEDSLGRPSNDELRQICMDVSLCIIAMKCMMAQRWEGGIQYRKAFESLMASFRLDLLESLQINQEQELRLILNAPLRNLRSIFLHLIGQGHETVVEALFALQRADQRLIAMLPSHDLQEYCLAARNNNTLRLASEAYALFVKAKTSSVSTSALPADCKHNLVRDGLLTDTDTFLVLMRELIAKGQKINVIAILRALRVLPLTDLSVAQVNLRFSGSQRSQLVKLLADVDLVEEAFELFQLWSHRRFDAESENSAFGQRRPLSAQVADPIIERQIRLMHGANQQVATSTRCLVALVRGICRQPSARSATNLATPEAEQSPNTADCNAPNMIPADRLKKAQFVIDVFRQAFTPVEWTHYKLTALARACFIAKDFHGAFDALAKISFLREVPDQVDVAVLLGGLVEHDADKAVDFFIQHCSVPHSVGAEKKGKKWDKRHARVAKVRKPLRLAPMKPTPELISMLIARVIAQDRMDLVERLYAFSEAVGLSSRLGDAASMRALFLPNVSPSAVIQTIRRMLQGGWKADPGLLENLAQRLLDRFMKRRAVPESLERPPTGSTDIASTAQDGRSLPSPKKDGLDFVKAAARLMQISARDKEVVNLRTVHRALDAIAHAKPLSSSAPPLEAEQAGEKVSGASFKAARPRGREDKHLRWVASLDKIVHLLRWTRFFDTGDDYRQSLPLWKLSTGSNGELVSAELDEMLHHGFIGSRRQLARSQTGAVAAAAAAATLPTLAELESQSTQDALDADENATPNWPTRTDGIVQQIGRRSPNVLPADLYRRLIETYLALGDASGAAEVASWMRDEAKVDIARSPAEASDFVDRIKAAVLQRKTKGMTSKKTVDQQEQQGQADAGSIKYAAEPAPVVTDIEGNKILRMLAGQQSTARTKAWWTL